MEQISSLFKPQKSYCAAQKQEEAEGSAVIRANLCENKVTLIEYFTPSLHQKLQLLTEVKQYMYTKVRLRFVHDGAVFAKKCVRFFRTDNADDLFELRGNYTDLQ